MTVDEAIEVVRFTSGLSHRDMVRLPGAAVWCAISNTADDPEKRARLEEAGLVLRRHGLLG
jgi:hypothetical protein